MRRSGDGRTESHTIVSGGLPRFVGVLGWGFFLRARGATARHSPSDLSLFPLRGRSIAGREGVLTRATA